MTNSELEAKLLERVKSERIITHEILILIREAELRSLHLERGFDSLHKWLVEVFGYSQSAANRRIQAARLLSSVPETVQKLEKGSVNLTTLCQLQSTLNSAERKSGQKISKAQKKELVEKIEGKSEYEAQKFLIEEFPDSAPLKESLRAVSGGDSKLTVQLDKEATEFLNRAKELLSHSNPGLSEVIFIALKEYVERHDPLLKKPAAPVSQAAIKREALRRANHQCEFKDSKTGRVCGGRHKVQVDHIIPRAKGGSDELENLRCLCRQHNILMAEREFGREFMNKWKTHSPELHSRGRAQSGDSDRMDGQTSRHPDQL